MAQPTPFSPCTRAELTLRVAPPGGPKSSAADAEVEHVDLQGVSVRAFDAEAFGRYVWLNLDLGDGDPVRALGEVVERRSPAAAAVDIRFKHLFPDYRARLARALER
ncbi:MAG: hypothetical protein FJ100_14735 [Deltaproteobacteria bacterium]|nr:hypothetical protein [Deltaproteobacteria bacterium]